MVLLDGTLQHRFVGKTSKPKGEKNLDEISTSQGSYEK